MVLKDLASSESRAAEHVENINVTAELLHLTPYTNIFTYQLMFDNEFALLGSRPIFLQLHFGFWTSWFWDVCLNFGLSD